MLFKQARVAFAFLFVAVLMGLGGCASTGPAPTAGLQRIVLQVSDDNIKTWNQSLNVARNLQQAYGKDKVEIELVAFGTGINMLKAEAQVANRVQESMAEGVHVYACENSMKGFKLKKDDMVPEVTYVEAGVVHLIKRQGEGWVVIRP
ncbi:MAG: DsrE family protein [Burkholderiales bacterium]